MKQVKLEKLWSCSSLRWRHSCTEDLRAFSFGKLEFKIVLFPCSHAHTKFFFFLILTGIFGYNIPRMGEKKLLENFCLANYKGRRPLGKLRHKWRIILQWFLDRNGGYGLDSFGSGQSSEMRCHKDVLEPSCCVKFGGFFNRWAAASISSSTLVYGVP